MVRQFLTVLLPILWVPALVAEKEKWDSWEAKRQPFAVTDNYVIAVGEKANTLELGQEEIGKTITALKQGKEIRFRDVKITKNFKYRGEVKKNFYLINTEFAREANFRGATFSGKVNFMGATFSGSTDFWRATFPETTYFGDVTFSGRAYFGRATFSGWVGFGGATLFSRGAYFVGATFSEGAAFWFAKFSGDAYFGEAKFSENVFFGEAKFSGYVGFINAEFSGDARFSATKFSRGAGFQQAKFSGDATFENTKFSENAIFNAAKFSGGARFEEAKFSENADFRDVKFYSEAQFERTSFEGKTAFIKTSFLRNTMFSKCEFNSHTDFSDCYYPNPDKGKMNFPGVTGISNVLINWKKDLDLKNDERDKDIFKYRDGLKGHLEYDEVFYLALIKNFQELGLWADADDVYFEYREQERTRKTGWKRYAEYWLLKLPFGYGVKPLFLLRTVGIPWFLFGCFYCLCVRKKEEKPIENIIPAKMVKFWKAFWTFLDNLNILPPGVDIHTLSIKAQTKPDNNIPPKKWMVLWKVIWAFLHSLNVLTPGIDLHTLSDKLLAKGPYRFQDTAFVQNVERIQRVIGWYLLALFLVMFSKIWIR